MPEKHKGRPAADNPKTIRVICRFVLIQKRVYGRACRG